MPDLRGFCSPHCQPQSSLSFLLPALPLEAAGKGKGSQQQTNKTQAQLGTLYAKLRSMLSKQSITKECVPGDSPLALEAVERAFLPCPDSFLLRDTASDRTKFHPGELGDQRQSRLPKSTCLWSEHLPVEGSPSLSPDPSSVPGNTRLNFPHHNSQPV